MARPYAAGMDLFATVGRPTADGWDAVDDTGRPRTIPSEALGARLRRLSVGQRVVLDVRDGRVRGVRLP